MRTRLDWLKKNPKTPKFKIFNFSIIFLRIHVICSICSD